MFIGVFVLFILILTLLENIYIGIWSLLILLLSIITYSIIKRILLLQLLFYCILAFLLAILSVYIKNYLYFENIPSDNKVYIGTGTVEDFIGSGKYLFVDISGNNYILNSKKEYTVGSVIYTLSYLKPALNKYNIFESKELNFNFLSGFDYSRRLYMKGYYGNLFETKSLIIAYDEPSLTKRAKIYIQSKIIDIYGKNDYGALISGILIGDKSFLSDEIYKKFIDSGLVHIIAVSGGNISMIIVFVGIILFFIPFYLRLIIILIFVTFYSFLCGLDSSVFRAWIMGGLTIIALFFGKKADIFRLIKYSVFILLFSNPYFLFYDIGFILSYMAVIGIVIFSKINSIFSFRNYYLNYINTNYIIPTAGATLGVLPIILFFSGKFNFLGIVANFIIVPVLPFIIIISLISLLIPLSFLVSISKLIIGFVFYITDISNYYGFYIFTNDFVTIGILSSFIIMLFTYIYKYKKTTV